MTNKILVVEDEALIADDVQRTLQGLGYDVPRTVATGEDAIRAADELQPDLVLTDIRLRGPIDGIEAATTIQQRTGAPIVFLTAHSDEATLARARQVRPHGYILKPFEDFELRTTIEVALQRGRMEEQLGRRERWLAATLQSIGDAVIATDPAAGITFMNAVAERLLGRTFAECAGRPIAEVFRVVDSAGLALPAPVGAALRDSVIVELPRASSLRLRDGHRIAVDDTAAPIVDEQGAVMGAVVVFRDVTAQRDLDARLVRSERLVALAGLAARLAGEINDPLACVMGNVAFAARGSDELRQEVQCADGLAADWRDRIAGRLSELGEAIVEASHASERVRQTLREMRRCGRQERGRPSVLDLPEVLETAANVTDEVVHRRARFVKQYGTTPFVFADLGVLTQVFVDLLTNAAQAIDEGDRDRNFVRIRTFTDGAGRATVEVSDSGQGICGEHLGRVFDPFFTTRADGVGMGLGLTICHNTVQALGGDIAVASVVGQGTTFRVALPPAPLRSAEPAVPAGPSCDCGPADTASSGRRARVLVVDDEPAVARAIGRMVSADHDVSVATSGSEALARVANGDFDLILCDLLMAPLTGIDVYEAIRVAKRTLADRMVFMIGRECPDTFQAFLDRVGNVWLAKPFGIETIRSLVADIAR